MAKNYALQEAARARQDEFYTSRSDIENEMRYYWEHFRGKTVLCNCDDPYESEFFKYFALFFNTIGLKKLIATCYAGSPIAQRQLSLFDDTTPTPSRKPYCAVIECMKDYNGDGRTDLLDAEYILQHGVGGGLRVLDGDGDFRSPECVKLLQEADIVATNPPHSLLREYIAILMKYNKKFIVLANMNAITYKEIFPLFMRNQMWLGLGNGDKHFRVPDYYEPRETRYWEEEDDSGHVQKFRSLGNICWFTNLEHHRHNETMILVKSYHKDPSKFPRYDNYDAIEVSKTVEIPYDYDGIMGVPITFLDKYNPKQFEILGLDRYIEDNPNPGRRFTINGREVYARILIRKIADFI